MKFADVKRWRIPEGDCVAVHHVLPNGERELLWELKRPLGIPINFVGIETIDNYGEAENIIEYWAPGYVTEHADGTKEFGYGYDCYDQLSALFWVVSAEDDWWNIAKGNAFVLYVNEERMMNAGEKIIIVIEERVSAIIYYNGTRTVHAYWDYNPIRIEIFIEDGIGKIRTYDRDGHGSTGANVDFSQPIRIYAK